MDWTKLYGTRILMTGGTGFIGSAMLDAFYLSKVDCELYVTTRNPIAQFHDRRVKRINHERLNALTSMDYVIHLEPDIERDSIPILWRASKFNSYFLYASSGAVIVNHDYYADIKRQRERTIFEFARLYKVIPIIARLWTFVGPHLPLDKGYAAGNFIRDGLMGGPIIVRGDGGAVRSYLYTSDMAEWMWTALTLGRAGIYNIGSDKEITVGELAVQLAREFGCFVRVENNPDVPSTRYVPDTSNTRAELDVTQRVELPEALRMTIEWIRENGGSQYHPA